MNRRRVYVAAAAFLLIVGGVLGVRNLDSLSSTPPGPELDFSESPEEIGQDAFLQTNYRDFTVDDYVTAADLPVEGQLSFVLASHEKYENSDREHGSWNSSGGRMTQFTNPYYTWDRANQTADRRKSEPDLALPQSHLERSLPGCDCVEIEAENSSTLVLEADRLNVVSPLADDVDTPGHPSTVTLVIDKEAAVLKTLQFRYYYEDDSDDGELAVLVAKKQFSNWGSTEVDRPSWAPITVEELVKDVQNVERESWIGDG